jgi:hypothetical protein
MVLSKLFEFQGFGLARYQDINSNVEMRETAFQAAVGTIQQSCKDVILSMDGKLKRKQEKSLHFRQLEGHELDQMLLRLHAPQQQVIVLNIGGNYIGDSGCSALSQALPHLSALQEMDLGCTLILFI